jgi:arsenate reductase
MIDNKPRLKVLFLSTTNSARSLMAAAFLRQRAGDRIEAYSAGLDPIEVNPYTRQVMDEVGLSLEEGRGKSVSDYLGKMHFGYVITVCDYAEQNCPTAFMGMGKRLHWSFADPNKFVGVEAARLAKFREVRDQIDRQVSEWLAEREV